VITLQINILSLNVPEEVWQYYIYRPTSH
jgi:hypothetical protein